MTNQELHLKTKSTATKYLRIESELVALLIEMDSRRAFKDLGYASLFQYCILELGFSEAVTSAFITVSRKAAQVPDLMQALEDQTLTVSKAAKISAALDIQCSTSSKQVADGNKLVIEFASQHSTAETEKWLREKRGVDTIHTLKIGSKLMEKLKYVRSLNKETLSQEEALEMVLDEYIQKHDPLKKAKRAESKLQSRKQKTSTPKFVQNAGCPVLNQAIPETGKQNPTTAMKPAGRLPIPASIKHQVITKAKNQCSHEIRPGRRCQNRKFLEIHHLKPVYLGGTNELTNLTLLCFAHHRHLHDVQLGRGRQKLGF